MDSKSVTAIQQKGRRRGVKRKQMHAFNFDTPADRRDTGSLKWEKYNGRDIHPMWVADMDFTSPPAVMKALHARVDHGIFGYTLPPPELIEIVRRRMQTQYEWEIDPEWIVWLPGLVTGLNLACRVIDRAGTAVATMAPIYPPFLSAPLLSGLQRRDIPMIRENKIWRIDFNALSAALKPPVKLLLLCNPHNPTGRVFGRQTLERIAALCLDNDVVLCSDEIHCDLILDPEKRHIPVASLSEAIADRTITLMAPSKTYNIPGLGVSFAIISNADLRGRFRKAMQGIVPMVNALGYTAASAAYGKGGDWLAALLDYLRGNRDLVVDKINAINGLETLSPQATYLSWIDCRATGIRDPAGFFEGAGVGLSDGSEFGAPGFLRLNFACPRAKLSRSLEKMRTAVMRYNK